jgi:hypothetical protein
MWFARLCVLLFTGFSINACGDGGKAFNWKQDVLLSDGRVIEVERVAKQTGKIFPENTVIEYEKAITFAHPDNGERIGWTLPKGTGAWMLDFDGGYPYLVLRTSSVADYNNWDCPNPPWLVFRFESGQWQRIGQEQLPARFVKPNLLHGARTDERATADGLYTVKEMEAYFRKIDPPRRVISREKVNANAHGCFPSVLERLGRANEITEAYGKGSLK